jgi:2-deoxy-D-gluconate 3-dehydrogenase
MDRQAFEKSFPANPNISFIECDVTREDQVKAMVDQAIEQAGEIHVLVNNAGIYPRKPLAEMTGGDFKKVMDVNLLGVFLCSLHVSRHMIEKGIQGSLVNILSIEALHPASTGMSAYDASKGGALMLTKSLARELGEHGIRVNGVAPGAILAPALQSSIRQLSPEDVKAGHRELKSFMARMVLGRMGEPDDVARAVLFLSTEMSSYITGEILAVDGGYLIS